MALQATTTMTTTTTTARQQSQQQQQQEQHVITTLEAVTLSPVIAQNFTPYQGTYCLVH